MAKKLKVKLPKRIAGIKIPRVVRKGPVADFMNSSGGQILIAEALVLAAGAFTAKHVDSDSPTAEALHHPIKTAKSVSERATDGDVAQQVTRNSERFAHAFRAAAQAFRRALEQDGGETLDTTSEPASDISKKKSSTSRTGTSSPH
jgi:hypothetical protein